MLDSHGTAYAGGSDLPRRFVAQFISCSWGAGGSTEPMPLPSEGFGYELTPPFAGFADYDVRDEISLLSGLFMEELTGHAFQCVQMSGTPRTPSGGPTEGPTADQIMAATIGAESPYPSLVYQTQVESYWDNWQPLERILSIADGPDGPEFVEPEVSPKNAFNRLFSNFTPPTNAEELARRDFELSRDRSVLDFVRDDRERLLGRLGHSDRGRVDQYFTAVRELEQEIAAMPNGGSPQGHCEAPSEPGDDPGTEQWYSGEHERAHVFEDLIHMAFVCDLTQVATHMLSFAASQMSLSMFTGFNSRIHGATHVKTNEQMGELIAWGTGHFARLVAKLRDTPEGAGNVLDNTALVFLLECGKTGTDPHSGENMIALLAGGRAGGLAPGQHIATNGMHPANVVRTAMTACGMPGTSLGNIEGVIPEAFA